jgi:hypothetical protein
MYVITDLQMREIFREILGLKLNILGRMQLSTASLDMILKKNGTKTLKTKNLQEGSKFHVIFE